jgi:hypothetical protein
MKERDTTILTVRVPKSWLPQISEKVERSRKYRTRNSWVLNLISRGIGNHKAKSDTPTGKEQTP